MLSAKPQHKPSLPSTASPQKALLCRGDSLAGQRWGRILQVQAETTGLSRPAHTVQRSFIQSPCPARLQLPHTVALLEQIWLFLRAPNPEQHLQGAALAQGTHLSTHKPQVLHSSTTGTNTSPQALAAASSGTAPKGEDLTEQKDAGKQPPLLCPSVRGSSTCTGSTEQAVGREQGFVEASAPQSRVTKSGMVTPAQGKQPQTNSAETRSQSLWLGKRAGGGNRTDTSFSSLLQQSSWLLNRHRQMQNKRDS